jgi:hypothetical protein
MVRLLLEMRKFIRNIRGDLFCSFCGGTVGSFTPPPPPAILTKGKLAFLKYMASRESSMKEKKSSLSHGLALNVQVQQFEQFQTE